MKTILYHCERFAQPITYYLIQHGAAESFQVYKENTLIGSVIKVHDRCIQVSGREISAEMLEDICKLI